MRGAKDLVGLLSALFAGDAAQRSVPSPLNLVFAGRGLELARSQ
jgi:hypothetical protein